jgi:hypothetical protein
MSLFFGGEADLRIRIFNGKTPLGHDFGHLYTNDRFLTNVENPLGEFAAKVFSE